jgi:hypothetical protein
VVATALPRLPARREWSGESVARASAYDYVPFNNDDEATLHAQFLPSLTFVCTDSIHILRSGCRRPLSCATPASPVELAARPTLPLPPDIARLLPSVAFVYRHFQKDATQSESADVPPPRLCCSDLTRSAADRTSRTPHALAILTSSIAATEQGPEAQGARTC